MLQKKKLCSSGFSVIGRMLLFDNPKNTEMEEATNYVLHSEISTNYAIVVIEIVLEACPKQSKKDIVHKLIQIVLEGDLKVDAARGDTKRAALLAKLLSECPGGIEGSTEIIKVWFPNLLREACGRGFHKLALDLYNKYESISEIISFDSSNGKSPLHAAAKHGEVKIVQMLLRHLSPKDPDHQGRTPLHIATREGHINVVEYLLANGSDPLDERDMRGRTALHYAVACRKGCDIAMQLVDKLVTHYKSEENGDRKNFFLILTSAAGIGTAMELMTSYKSDIKKLLRIHTSAARIGDVKKYLDAHLKTIDDVNKCLDAHLDTIKKRMSTDTPKKRMSRDTPKPLQDAAEAGNPTLAWEFLIRGGFTDEIDAIPRNIWRLLKKNMEHGIERPTYVDTLGRNALAECIAEHFLNSNIKTPITASISGGNGMGKTSLMNQVKAYLQITHSQLAFPLLWKYEKLSGGEVRQSKKGERMIHKIEDGIIKLMETKKEIAYGCPEGKKLVQFLERYRPEHEAVYKYLACMDFAQLLENEEDDSGYLFQGQLLGAAPRVLTVDFSAGMYRENKEAWSGLAVKITQAIEDSMTWPQMMSTRWRNAARLNKTNFWLKFILPGLLMIFLVGWIAWGAWLLLDRTDNKSLQDLKYGSIPATIIAIVWGIVGKASSIFKSVSTKMEEYFNVGEYSQNLPYQEHVISDIKFLKKEIGKPPYCIFSLIAWAMCNNWFGLWKDNIKDTCIPKYGSPNGDKLQIIAFVDDLDRCEDEAILKVLWSINLVFRECDINFILAVDKTTLQTAFRNSTGSRGADSVDEFISKIIQLPVDLPDAANDEWKAFIQDELGVEFTAERDQRDHVKIPNDVENNPSSSVEAKGSSSESHSSGYKGCIPCSLKQRRSPTGKSEDIEAGRDESKNCQLKQCEIEKSVVRYVEKSDLWESKELTKRMLDVRGSLMLTYDKEEIQTFDQLRRFAEERQKFPRKWKCFIKYHRFARNVIIKKARKMNIIFPVVWKAEFVAWTFVCINWKAEMNILMKNWYKLIQEESSSKMNSLRDVVVKYKKQRWLEEDEKDCKKLTEALNRIQGIPKNWAEGFKEFEIKCVVKKEETEFNYKTTQSIIDAEEEERERWDDLKNFLSKYQNVRLECLHIFQEFRFHCDAQHLQFPFPKENVIAKE